MPKPTPNSGESRDAFISRCMSDETMQSDHPDEEGRRSACAMQWDNGEPEPASEPGANWKAERVRLLDKAAAIRDNAKDEGRDINATEQGRIQRLVAQAEKLRKDGEARDRVHSDLDAALGDLDRINPRKTAPKAVTERIRDAVLDDPKRGFASIGHFAQRVFQAGPAPWNDRDLLRAAAGDGATQGIRQDGGVLVPPQYRMDLWDRARTASDSLLQYCDVIDVDQGVESVSVPVVYETSRADGSRWGNMRGYWKSELSQLTSSKLKFAERKLEPQELYVFTYVSDKLLRNAPVALTSIINRAAPDEINFKIGDAILNGTGSGMPQGIIGHASVVSVAKEGGQAAATIVKKNIDKMYSRCHAKFRAMPGTMWLINQECEVELENLAAEVGVGGVPIYIPAGGYTEAPNARLKGKPVMVCEYSAALGTVGDILFGNLRAYAIGLKGMVDQNMSMHLKFDFAQTCFRWIFEIDGQPWLDTTLTAYKGTSGSNTYSPLVSLATRS